jgi:hypothetical protein
MPFEFDKPSPARRHFLASSAGLVAASGFGGGAMVAAPAGAQALAEGTPGIEFAYEALVTLDPATFVGPTPLGRRNRIPITGGTFEGPRIGGEIVPGGMDWQLIRADGFMVIEADYMMRASDGALIHVYNKGVTGVTDGQRYGRTTPIFEAPDGPHAWLNKAVFVGTLGQVPGRRDLHVRIRVYKVT